MTLDQVFRLVHAARELTKHRELVVIGSNSVLGLAETTSIPAAMSMSIDLDSYLKNDPGWTGDLVAALGENSEFHRREGFFLDMVSPHLPTLPEGWQGRLMPVRRDGATAWFIDPDDAAISKYARGEPRDQRWIRAGIEAGIVSLPKVKALLGRTSFLDAEEDAGARMRVDEDERWFAARRASGDRRNPEG